MFREMFRDLKNSRELAWRLAVRDIKALYRQSFLGYFWAFLLPVINTATWLFLQGTGIVQVAETSLPYPVYVFVGTMLWQIFTEAVQSPLQQVGESKSILSKLNFPRESLILAGIYKSLFNATIKVGVLLVAILLLGVYPDASILLFPLGVLSILLVGNTIGLFLGPIGVLYTDIGKAIPVITQFTMYITPVVFAIPAAGLTAKIFEYNFLTPLIMNSRAWLTGSETEFVGYFLIVNAAALVLLMVSWIIYRITMPILIERMNA